MRALFYGLLLLTVGVAPGWADPVVHRGEEIERSASDLRDYRYLRLANGLQVMLVSDTDSEKAAASLDVNVGSAHNPPDRQGLAHFLEHMLFLGTKKYPDPAEYHAFISGHGGSNNAFTAMENTNYFFDIAASQLEPALDRFAQFFVAPLFDDAYVEREKHAVHSEFRASIREDSRRFMDALAEVVNPEHPFGQFTVGNLDTLDGDIRADLLDFYARYYSADRMALTVVGPQTLDELEAMVVPRFAEVPRFEAAESQATPPIFEEGRLPLLLEVQPERELHRVSLLFPMPSQRDYLGQKPLVFLAHMVGHEGEGSILDLLKQQGWADSLGAGEGRAAGDDAFFQVDIGLTESGLRHVWSVVDVVFAGIEQIGAQGIEEWRYQEQSELAELAFRYQENTSSTGAAIRIAMSLQDYDYREVLRGPGTFSGFDAELIRRHWALLTRDNVLVSIMSPDVEVDQESRFYGTPYAVSPVDFPPRSRKQQRLLRQLDLPEPNPYKPETLTVINDEQTATAVPQRLDTPEGGRLWWHGDGRFQIPRGSFYLHIRQPQLTEPADVAARAVLLEMIRDQLSTQTYPALLAGLSYRWHPTREGVALMTDGFSDRQPAFYEAVLQGALAPEWSRDRFERVRAELERSVRNRALGAPYLQALSRLRTTLSPGQVDDPELAAALADLRLADVRRIHPVVFKDGTVDLLVSGNFSADDAQSLFQLTRQQLTLTEEELPRQRGVLRLTDAQGLFHELDHTDVAYIHYIQGRNDSMSEAAAFAVLRRILQPPFFHSLRTEQQLGYVVTMADGGIDLIPGLAFVVQSPSAGAVDIDTAVNDFIELADAYLAALDEEGLDRYREAVLTGLRERPKSLTEQTQRFRNSIDLEELDFDRRARLIAAVEALDKAQLESLWHAIRAAQLGSLLLIAAAENELELPEELSVTGQLGLGE